MPSGITHDRITLWTLFLVAAGGYLSTRNGELTLILTGGYLFSGLMFGPDLDIHSIQSKRWGWFKGIWQPYRNLFRHRSFFSHGPIFGTVIRVLYLFFLIASTAILVVGIAQAIWGFEWNWRVFVLQQYKLLSEEYLQEIMVLFIGLELGAMSHSISDLVGSNHKRRLKMKKKRSSAKTTVKITKLGKINKVKR